jgi:hypothetical protein
MQELRQVLKRSTNCNRHLIRAIAGVSGTTQVCAFILREELEATTKGLLQGVLDRAFSFFDTKSQDVYEEKLRDSNLLGKAGNAEDKKRRLTRCITGGELGLVNSESMTSILRRAVENRMTQDKANQSPQSRQSVSGPASQQKLQGKNEREDSPKVRNSREDSKEEEKDEKFTGPFAQVGGAVQDAPASGGQPALQGSDVRNRVAALELSKEEGETVMDSSDALGEESKEIKAITVDQHESPAAFEVKEENSRQEEVVKSISQEPSQKAGNKGEASRPPDSNPAASAPSERRPQPDSDSRDDRSARKGTRLEEEKHEEKGCSASYGEARMGGISLAFAAFKVDDAYQAINRGRKELSRAREEFEQGIRERSYCCADPDTNPREDDFQEALQIAMFRAKSALGHLQVAESILSDIRNENFAKDVAAAAICCAVSLAALAFAISWDVPKGDPLGEPAAQCARRAHQVAERIRIAVFPQRDRS